MKPKRIKPGDKVAISRSLVGGLLLCPQPGHDTCASTMCDTHRGVVYFACGHTCRVIFTYCGEPIGQAEK